MRPIVIVHFNPIELYPPVTNFLLYLQKNYKGRRVDVYTTKTAQQSSIGSLTDDPAISIFRYGGPFADLGAVSRLYHYCLFYLGVFIRLIRSKPKAILYYETLSSYPAYLYKKYINKNIRILIHYHEYVSPNEYLEGMKLTRYFHRKEESLYSEAIHISQTNEMRQMRFAEDEKMRAPKVSVIPNFPPKDWYRYTQRVSRQSYKIVYVGAFDLDTMYVKEFSEWINSLNGKANWDIYSWNITPKTRQYIDSLNSEWISIKTEVAYYDLPDVLSNYEIGVILYRGHIPNYVLNAPNKLFEYYACGLDVWYPHIMEGIWKYNTSLTYPKIIPCNFDHLEDLDFDQLVSIEGHSLRQSEFYYENVFPQLAEKIVL